MELTINNLSKTYPNGVQALKNIDLTISTGMFGLLGPNGAGKSTLMRTIATLQEANSGAIQMNGLDILQQPQEVKKILGYLPQEFGFYKKDTPWGLVRHFALLKGVRDKNDREKVAEVLLKKVNLWDQRHQKLGTFSGGMKQRLGISL